MHFRYRTMHTFLARSNKTYLSGASPGADRGLACAAALDLGEALVGDGINNRGLDAQPLEGRGGPLERGGDGGPEREGEERDFSIG